jgi:hypothetical protein
MADAPGSTHAPKWREDAGIYVAVASFLIAALSRLTALEVFVAMAALYSILTVLFLFIASPSIQSLVEGAAVQYSLLSALVMPFFAAFQPGFWAFIGLYSAAWWAFLFLLIEVQSRSSPAGTEIDKTGHAYFGMIWLMCIPLGGIVRVIWSLVRADA